MRFLDELESSWGRCLDPSIYSHDYIHYTHTQIQSSRMHHPIQPWRPNLSYTERAGYVSHRHGLTDSVAHRLEGRMKAIQFVGDKPQEEDILCCSASKLLARSHRPLGPSRG